MAVVEGGFRDFGGDGGGSAGMMVLMCRNSEIEDRNNVGVHRCD